MAQGQALGRRREDHIMVTRHLTAPFRLIMNSIATIDISCLRRRLAEFQRGPGRRIFLMNMVGFVYFDRKLVAERARGALDQVLKDGDTLAHIAVVNHRDSGRRPFERSELRVVESADAADQRFSRLLDG